MVGKVNLKKINLNLLPDYIISNLNKYDAWLRLNFSECLILF